MTDILLPAAVTVAVSVALYFFNRGSRTTSVITGAGFTELRMSVLYLVVGGTSLVVSAFWLLMPVLAQEYTSEIFTVSGVMFLLFVGFTCFALLWYRNHKVFFNADTLSVADVYGRYRQLRWAEIKIVQFNAFSGLLTVADGHGHKVSIHQHLVGFVQILLAVRRHAMERHLNFDALPLKSFGL